MVFHPGGLDWEEFRHLLQHFLPGEITKSEAMGVIKAIDADGDGLIQWEELEGFVKEYQRGRKKEEKTSYSDRKWKESKHYSRHRKSLIAMDEGDDAEGEWATGMQRCQRINRPQLTTVLHVHKFRDTVGQ